MKELIYFDGSKAKGLQYSKAFNLVSPAPKFIYVCIEVKYKNYEYRNWEYLIQTFHWATFG